MYGFAIPRLDTEATGIHLVWAWSSLLPLSIKGYDVQRLTIKEEKWISRCETIDSALISQLRTRFEYPMPLGLLRMQAGVKSHPMDDPSLYYPPRFIKPVSGILYDEFIQELDVPVQRVTITSIAKSVLAVAQSQGKVVAVGNGLDLTLVGSLIDTIRIYTQEPRNIILCIYERNLKDDQNLWSTAPYVVQNLTLPMMETDPSLTSEDKELAVARQRLLSNEFLTKEDFSRLIATLRKPAAATELGRSGERISLVRPDLEQSFEEVTFSSQLGVLTLLPRIRRMFGFGCIDRKNLVMGDSYSYRITGRFDAADLFDDIYDVHRVPVSTVLPVSFSIRSVNFRFQIPVKVVLDPEPSEYFLHDASRRGIQVDTADYDPTWIVPSLDKWSVIINFPYLVPKVVLEVAPGHSFTYAAGMPFSFNDPEKPLPEGTRVELDFPNYIMELRLAGTGTLYAVRLPSGKTGIVEEHTYIPAVKFAPQPLPNPPTIFTIHNLQQPRVVLTGTIDESTTVQPRPPAGFKLNWLPATQGNIPNWPVDLEGGPPLNTLCYLIEHRTVDLPATYGPWEPINGGDNLVVGSRDSSLPVLHVEHGCDLDAVFPAVRTSTVSSGLALHFSDVFGLKDPATGIERPSQSFGTYHQYQIRSMDVVGRISATATLSDPVRLEKHIPPPLPTGPQPAPVPDSNNRVTGPTGPRARVIIRHAPGLTASDLAILGEHQNAILLEWGWRQAERELDPTTTEFRVYITPPPDIIHAQITAVSSASPNWQLNLITELPLIAEELVGQWLTSDDYPFFIVHNTAGTNPTIFVEISKVQPTKQPRVGAVTFGRPLRPEHTRPSSWAKRVAIYELTSEKNYRHIFYDELTLSLANPECAFWVGVTAADDQYYVLDERTSGDNSNRPGNESGVAICSVVGRYRGQPELNIPPPLGEVPEIVSDEPTGREVLITLDLKNLLANALPDNSPILLERCSSDEILKRLSVSGNDIYLDKTETVIFNNPSDKNQVLAILHSNNPQRLDNRYLLYIVVNASDPSSFFTPVSKIIKFGKVNDQLAPKPGRFLYSIRAADALGNLSNNGAILPVMVRVPSLANAVTPNKRDLLVNTVETSLTVEIESDPDTTAVLLFAYFIQVGSEEKVREEAKLLRIPNRRDLYPHQGIRLQLGDGTLLAPLVAKNLSDPDVLIEADGKRVVTLTTATQPCGWVTVWCYTLTRDGIPSRSCGPFSTGVHA